MAYVIATEIPRHYFYFEPFAVDTAAEAAAAVAVRVDEVCEHLQAENDNPDDLPAVMYAADRLSCHIMPSLDMSTYRPSSLVRAILRDDINAETYNAEIAE